MQCCFQRRFTNGVVIIRKTQARLLAFAGVKHYLLASDNEDAMTRTPNSLSDLTQHMLDAAKAAGADQADAVAAQGTSVSIDVRNGVLEHAERSEGVDIGLRVFIGSAGDFARLGPAIKFAGYSGHLRCVHRIYSRRSADHLVVCSQCCSSLFSAARHQF